MNLKCCHSSLGATSLLCFVFGNVFSLFLYCEQNFKERTQLWHFVGFGCLDTVFLWYFDDGDIKCENCNLYRKLNSLTTVMAKYRVLGLSISNWVKFGWIAWKDWETDCWIFHLSWHFTLMESEVCLGWGCRLRLDGARFNHLQQACKLSNQPPSRPIPANKSNRSVLLASACSKSLP